MQVLEQPTTAPTDKESLEASALITKREILTIIHAHNGHEVVGSEDVLTLRKELQKIKTPRDQTQIDLILNSPGGDIHSAYMLVRLVRSRCKSLNVIVPYYAKSAATLMCLGADRIYMAPYSELGPLDAQLEIPTAEGRVMSALDGVKPLEILSSYCENLAVRRMGLAIRSHVALSRESSVKLALDFSGKLVQPIIRQLDPLVLNMCFRYLQVAERYGRELLTEYMFKGETHGNEMADAAIRELVWEYPEHGYAIAIDEARRLKLVVDEAERLPEWDAMWNYYEKKEADGGTHIHLVTEELIGQAGKIVVGKANAE